MLGRMEMVLNGRAIAEANAMRSAAQENAAQQAAAEQKAAELSAAQQAAGAVMMGGAEVVVS